MNHLRNATFMLVAFLNVGSVQWLNDEQQPRGVNGGVIAVPLPDDAESAQWGKDELLRVANHAIVPIDLETEPGVYSLGVKRQNGDVIFTTFEVSAKSYPEQHITIKDTTKVTPPPEVLDRIARESALMNEIYELRSPTPSDLLPISVPVDGPITGVFGSRRFFNGLPRNPHSGIDYAGAQGTPIISPSPGVVALTGDFYFNGNTVMIDHGKGFVSVMCHLHEIEVEKGQRVARGERIGTVGSTGRSTGPHLHWTTRLQGIRVDPAVVMDVLNSLYDAG